MEFPTRTSVPKEDVTNAVSQGKGWMSTAEPFIVDGIVAALHNHPSPRFCWNRTRPSLRLLNKHWCREMNRHILNIQPGNNLRNSDFDTLLKFSNLKNLDIAALSFPKKLVPLMQTMHRMPKLNHLTVALWWLELVERADLEGLQCKSVSLFTAWSDPRSVDDLIKLSVLQMERVDFWRLPRGWITDFLRASPSVKRLAIEDVKYENDFEALAALEELDLEYKGKHPTRLAELTSLVTLKALVSIESFDAFKRLEKLRDLCVEIAQSFAFDGTFYRVIRQLNALEIRGASRHRIALPPDFLEASTGLEELRLSRVVVDTSPFNHLPLRLLRLGIDGCELKGASIPWNRLTSLTSLDLLAVSGIDYTPILESMDLSPLKKLRRLSLCSIDAADMSLELLQSVKELTNLEFWEMDKVHGWWDPCQQDMFQVLEELPHLMKTTVSTDYDTSDRGSTGV